MKINEIEIPEGKKAEWVNGVFTLVDEPKKYHQFKVGDKAILKADTCFLQVSGDFAVVNSGTEVEIESVSDNADAITEKVYKVKHQHSTAMVLGRKLDKKIEYKFKVGDKVRDLNNPELIYTVIRQFSEYGEPMYRLKGSRGETSSAEKWLELVPQDIIECIKTFGDACKWCEENGHSKLIRKYEGVVRMNQDISYGVVAYLKLRIITCALNEGWEPIIEDGNYKSFVGYNAQSGEFDLNVCRFSVFAPKDLLFKSESLALYAAKQFKDIYEDFYGCNKTKEQMKKMNAEEIFFSIYGILDNLKYNFDGCPEEQNGIDAAIREIKKLEKRMSGDDNHTEV